MGSNCLGVGGHHIGGWERKFGAFSAPAGAFCATAGAVLLGLTLLSPVSAGELRSAPPPSVAIIQPTRGDVLSGTERIVARTSGVATAVRFEWSPDRALWRPIGFAAPRARESSARWDTRVHSGKAWVRVVAHFGAETARDAVEVRVFNGSPTLNISATPKTFSPNSDGRKERTRIRVSSNKDGRVVVRILNDKDRTLRSWKRRSRNGRVRRIIWKGRTREGRRVSDGRYRVEAVMTDRLGTKERKATTVVVDTRAPRIRWKAFHKPSRSGGDVEVTFVARDRSGPLHVAAVVEDTVRPISSSKTYTRRPGRTTLRFTPRDKNRESLLPGTYFARIRARDYAGNVRVSASRSWVVYRNVGSRIFWTVPNPGRGVALTFDDCDFTDAWAAILRALARYDAHATFFCPGRQVLANPELARASVKQGHTPAAHGWDHAWLSGRSAYDVAWRLRKDRAAWRRTTGVSSVPFFRPPYGANSNAVREGAAETSHFRIIMWDVDPSDYTNPPPSAIASRVLQRVRPGSIVVMHTRRNTAAALPTILRGLQSRSLEAQSLAELFRR